ncbi:MAG: hypothetical protein U0Z53_06095 [Blastocatellia bacterium]
MTREQSDVLIRIKRAVISGRIRFSNKAQVEMDADGLTELDVVESILNAVAVYKKIRSRSPYRQRTTEYLYVIQSTNLDGLFIYTKGKLVREGSTEIFYLLISAKRAVE